MGQEISQINFSLKGTREFQKCLKLETTILMNWFSQDVFENDPHCGVEVESWLLDQDMIPCPEGDLFLTRMDNELVVPEISTFNFEINGRPHPLSSNLLSITYNDLLETWKLCEKNACEMNRKILMIGSLPTIRDHMLKMDYLSPQKRYFALNEQVMSFRKGNPIVLDIEGKDQIRVVHNNVITESAATSLQIHIGVNVDNGKRMYNAACIASPFMVAACANSPYLYGKELWEETRIPIFEQSIDLNGYRDKFGEHIKRVSLGSGYVKESIFELFLENLNGFSPLLPELFNDEAHCLKHLSLHNGTIWRWNRPLVGVTKTGKAHIRIEHRVPSSGPSLVDTVANIALFLGLQKYLSEIKIAPENLLSFKDLKKNFYAASKYGLNADIKWIDGKSYNLQDLLLNHLFDKIVMSLEKMDICKRDINYYFKDVLFNRLLNGQTGSFWQKSYIHTHGNCFQEMVEKYYENQNSGKPVWKWTV